MVDLNALAVFAKVADAGSFSEAGRRLKMPVSTVSRKIAELEADLGVQLLERSTRNLRLTGIGSEVLEQAWRALEVSETLDGIVSDKLVLMTGMLRLAAPPNISDSLISPIVTAFQTAHPSVRIEIMITERRVDHIAEGIDLTFHVGPLTDAAMAALPLLRFRHQLVASPDYVRRCDPPQRPSDLTRHRILAFSHFRPEYQWTFTHATSGRTDTVTFQPHLGINDFSGITAGLLAGAGIGDLSPIVQPELVRDGRLIEIMPEWRFPIFELSLIHLRNRYTSRQVRVFKEVAADVATSIFPDLPV